MHTGVFVCAYFNNKLVTAHVVLYANVNAANDLKNNKYLCRINNLEAVHRLCFLVCTNITETSIIVIHDMATHPRNLQEYHGGKYAFLHNAGPGKRAGSVELCTSWFDKDPVIFSTFNVFKKTI